MGDIFRFESSAVPEGVRVAAFKGREALSELYRFEVGLLVPEGARWISTRRLASTPS